MSEIFSDYIVYVDESGDHGLVSIDAQYPVFVLAFCIFEKGSYTQEVTPALQQLKLHQFGHDMVILHEHEIRKAKGAFTILVNPVTREAFMTGLDELIDSAPFTLIASVIRKENLKESYSNPYNPYEIALGFGLERVHSFLRREKQADRKTHVVFESRGKKEDEALRTAFVQVVTGGNYWGRALPLDCVIAHKKANSCGLQLADLVARPIGRRIMDSSQGVWLEGVSLITSLQKTFDPSRSRGQTPTGIPQSSYS